MKQPASPCPPNRPPAARVSFQNGRQNGRKNTLENGTGPMPAAVFNGGVEGRASDATACERTGRHPGRGGQWLEKVARGCLAAAALALASCAHCQRCSPGASQRGTRCEHGECCDKKHGKMSCQRCDARPEAKRPGGKPVSGKQSTRPAAGNLKAGAEPTLSSTLEPRPLWFR
jgi:hypothetical protein